MNIVTNFVAKRVGSAIGSQAFNNQTTSCDGLNRQGNPCCYNSREAQNKKMPVCNWNAQPKKK